MVYYPHFDPFIILQTKPKAKQLHTLTSNLINMDPQPVLTSFLLQLLSHCCLEQQAYCCTLPGAAL